MKKNLALLILLSLLNQTSLFWGNPVLAQKETADKQKASNLELVFKPDSALSVTAATFSPDQKYLVTGTKDGTICFWDNIQGRERRRVKAYTDSISNIIFAPDGEHFLTTSASKTAKLWKIISEKEIAEMSAQNLDRMYVKKLFDFNHKASVTAAAFSPDGNSILTADIYTIYLWNTTNGNLFKSFKNGAEILSVGFSPDGKIIVTTDYNGEINFWDPKSGNQIKSLKGHTSFVNASAFTPDGKFLATSSSDRTVKIWEVVTGRLIKTFHTDIFFTGKMMFSPDGGRLSVVNDEASIHVYDVRSGELIRKIQSALRVIGIVEFSPDGRYLIAPQETGAVSLISLETGKQFCQIVSFKDDSWAVIDHQTRFDASEDAEKNLEYKYGNETIALKQLKDLYYTPLLLARLLGFNKEPLPQTIPLSEIKIYPEITSQKIEGKTLTLKLKNRGGGIGEVLIFVNDKLISADARDRNLKANPNMQEAVLSVDMSDSPHFVGENKVKIVTSNFDKNLGRGTFYSQGLEMLWKVGRGTGVYSINDGSPNFYAIVVGVSDYAGDNWDLKFAAKDAEDFSNALRLGAQRLFCEKSNPNCSDKVKITTLSTSGKAGTIMPTKANLKKMFEEVAAQSKPNDTVAIYLSGHAFTEKDSYLFFTQEAGTLDKTALADESVRKQITVSSDELAELSGKIRALKQVLILDTDSAGTFSNKLTQVKDVSSAQIRALERLKDKTGLWILMGAAADQVSYEASRYGQGVLTYALLEGLKGAALDSNGVAQVEKLFSYAQERVPQIAKDIGGIQRPFTFSFDTSGFAIGQFTSAEQKQISLAKVYPVILRPKLMNSNLGYDDLELTRILRGKLREASFTQSGGEQSQIVYVEADEMTDAILPSGSYSIEGETVKVKIVLVRNKVVLSAISLSGKSNNLEGLMMKITQSIIESANELNANLRENFQNKDLHSNKLNISRKQSKNSIVPANEFFSTQNENSIIPVKFSAQTQQTRTQNDNLLITPPVIRRKMLDGKEIADDIGLGEEIRKQTQKISENPATESKVAVLIFLQGGNPKGAYRPQIIYTIDGKKFKAELTIHRDEMQVTDAVKIGGATDNLAFLAELVVEMILEQVKTASQTKGMRVVNLAAQKDIYDSKGRDFALFIANDEYDHLTDLQNPVDDVTAVAERLKNIYGFETEIAGPVVDGKKIVKTESVDDFYNEINALQRRQFDPEKDQLLVFISGHGDYDGDVEAANGIGYYAVKQSKTKGGDPNHLSYVNFENLKNLLNRLKCKHILLVIDSCFSGAIDESTTKSGGIYGEMSNAEYISKKMNLTTRKVLTSGELQYTWDGERGKHSPFVAKFLESLDTFGGDDGILTTLEIYTKLEKLNPQPKRGKFSEKDENSSEFLFVRKRN